MTIQVDDPSLPSAMAGATTLAVDAGRYVHPATRMTVVRRPVPSFDVVVELVTGQLDLVGEFDMACGARFRQVSAAIVAGDAAEVVVDLAGLRFIDASGIEMLIELRNALAVRDATLRVANADARIGRVFSLCGLDAMLTALPAP
jgi:anti-sigma B factor antagonist